jgi:hypothetical protein
MVSESSDEEIKNQGCDSKERVSSSLDPDRVMDSRVIQNYFD